MRLIAWHAPRRAAPADLLRRARGRRARDGAGGHPARGDHDRRAPARARLSHARARQVAPRRGGADAAHRAGLRRVSRLPGGRFALPRGGRSELRELGAGLRSDRPLPVGEPAVRGAQGRRAALRARRLHDRLSRARGRASDRGEPQPPVLPLPRLQRAAHAAPGAALRLRRAVPDREPHAARVRGDDPRARPRRRHGARRAARERARARTRS